LAKGTIQGLAKGGLVGKVRGFKKAGDVRLGVGTFVGAGTGAAAAGPVDELIPGKVQQEGPRIAGLRQQTRVFNESPPEILEEVPGVGFGPAQLEQEREHGVAVVIEDLFKRVHAVSMDRTPRPRGFV
jgi:hypothetical protein